MAYVKKSGGCHQVRKGNSGQLLKSFCGSSGEKDANKYVSMLHAKNKPKASNRGKSAQKRNDKK